MNIYRFIVIVVIVVGLGYSFSIFHEVHNDAVYSYDPNSENYQSDNYYETIVSSEFDNSTPQEFTDFYEEYYEREGIDLQRYMTPQMLIALGSRRIGYEQSAKANYREVVNEYFCDHTHQEFNEFATLCQQKFGVNIREYLDPEYANQL